MTFTEALKELAEMMPDRFKWYDGHIPPTFGRRSEIQLTRTTTAPGKLVKVVDCMTQDDMDEILALCDYVYYVLPIKGGWSFIAGSLDDPTLGTIQITGESPEDAYPTKLLAAQAALIAVAQRIKDELCPKCGRRMEAVRPGKVQCGECG